MRILVTGKNGQLGSELQEIQEEFPTFNFTFTDRTELDITNSADVVHYFENNSFDAIINCAAYTAVDKAEEEPEKAFAVNAEGVKNLVQACKKHNIKLIHISTDYVFDGTSNVPYKETDAVNPLGVYGKSKRRGEEYILDSNLAAVIIRTSWLYSIYGNNFVKTMLRLGRERESINVVCDQVGSPTNAKDLARACLVVLQQHEKWGKNPEIFHYSNEGSCSWYEFAMAIFEISGIACKVVPIRTEEYPKQADRPLLSILDTTRIHISYIMDQIHWIKSLKLSLDNDHKNIKI